MHHAPRQLYILSKTIPPLSIIKLSQKPKPKGVTFIFIIQSFQRSSFFFSSESRKHALAEVKLRFCPSSGGVGEEHVRRNNNIDIDMARCFGLGSVLVLAALAASMVVLPLMLPPLPPPPLVLLFFPVGIMAALMLLAFSPSDQNGVVYAST
ncbi:hypothetical protein D0Y65_030376 [Glycine soja]|nr:hypothetical protein D0Y65_030376 [Glycine soja]